MSRTDELIKRVLELDAAATPGPWISDIRGVYRVETVRSVLYDEEALDDDVDLVAEYRTLAPLLAKMLQRAMEELRSVAVSSSWRIRQDAEDAIEEIEETV